MSNFLRRKTLLERIEKNYQKMKSIEKTSEGYLKEKERLIQEERLIKEYESYIKDMPISEEEEHYKKAWLEVVRKRKEEILSEKEEVESALNMSYMKQGTSNEMKKYQEKLIDRK